jgi:hypothetical protein
LQRDSKVRCVRASCGHNVRICHASRPRSRENRELAVTPFA